MNKRSLGWLHPAVIYLILLILVIVVSWIGSIMEIGRGAGNEELALRSVLGVPGLRWAVRTAASCLGNAPVGNALMLFMAIGAGRGSGLFRALSRLRAVPFRGRVHRRRAGACRDLLPAPPERGSGGGARRRGFICIPAVLRRRGQGYGVL